MIYLDTSVALAHLFAENRRPPASLWDEELTSSRLLEYELWTRIHARGVTQSHSATARWILGRTALVAMVPPVLARALEPFPRSVRTLDALHLATAVYLRAQGASILIASYDSGLTETARQLGFPIATL